jgi:hemoglobin
VEALVNDGVRHISADTRINARFAQTSPTHLNASLVDLVCERTGGPCVYKGRDMSAAHEGMEIRDDEFDALVDDLARAMDDRKIRGAERAELLALLARMRNAIVGH